MKSRIAFLHCETYDEDAVYENIKKGFELLGGLEHFFKKEERILLKLNLVREAEPQRAVTTHPSVAAATARIFFESGYGRLCAGDSCGIGSSAKIMEALGLEAPFEKYNVKMLDFKTAERVEYKEGIHAKSFIAAKDALEADAIVSLAKMKTHALEYITGAVKNQYGCIQGLNKAKGHTVYPSQESFAKMLVDLNMFLKPRFYILDGITAMEGNGPVSGEPVQMNTLIMGDDPVAVDALFCALIHLPPKSVPTNVYGRQMGLGTYLGEEIDVVTNKGIVSFEEIVRKYGNPSFDVVRNAHSTRGIMGLVTRLNRFKRKPKIDASLCVKCGVCTEICPVEGKAIGFVNGRALPPVYDYKKCIRCFCCQEMCPHKAIYVGGQKRRVE